MSKHNAPNYDLDRFKIRTFRQAALVLLLVGFLLFACIFAQKLPVLSPLSALAAILLFAGLPFAHMADEIERGYELETAQEVSAFLGGADPDEINRDRTSSRASRIAQRTVADVAFALVFVAAVAVVVAFTILS